MKILIVDGNEKKASDNYHQIGMLTQYELYKDVLLNLLNEECNILTIHPAFNDDFIPRGINLDDFDGIVWTGSLLNIYDLTAPIKRQIDLAKELFKRKNKIFGSCWGLQVLVTAAGGSIKKNSNGLEAVIAKNINLNEQGINHSMYKGKPKIFDSFCWHYDEVENTPINSNVLSSNDKSFVQSIAFDIDESEIWAVQYHPEFDPNWISGLMSMRKNLLIDENIFENLNDYNNTYLYLSDLNKYDYLKDVLSISNTLINNNIHKIELSNWLNNLKSSI
ncbi:type 1 glutamine amidotransferase [Alphaproteobacteria bacterium]|nr:type 1 glutamine amidotransferase [Alphaproteobacteria bacterium]